MTQAQCDVHTVKCSYGTVPLAAQAPKRPPCQPSTLTCLFDRLMHTPSRRRLHKHRPHAARPCRCRSCRLLNCLAHGASCLLYRCCGRLLRRCCCLSCLVSYPLTPPLRPPNAACIILLLSCRAMMCVLGPLMLLLLVPPLLVLVVVLCWHVRQRLYFRQACGLLLTVSCWSLRAAASGCCIGWLAVPQPVLRRCRTCRSCCCCCCM